MTPHSSIKNERTSHTSSGSERSDTTHHTKSEITIDEVGAQLFATIKTLMSGDGTIKRVLTVATTNQTGIPDALARGGRFQSVYMEFPFSKIPRKAEQDYSAHILYMLEVFSATHCRKFGLTVEPKEFKVAIRQARSLFEKNQKIVPKKPQINTRLSMQVPQLTGEQRKKIRDNILDFLEITEGEVREKFIPRIESFSWYVDEILKRITGLSQGEIANMYKGMKPGEVPDITKIKHMLAEFLFVRELKK